MSITIAKRIGGYTKPLQHPEYWVAGTDLYYGLYRCANCSHPILVSIQGTGVSFNGSELEFHSKKPVLLYPMPKHRVNPSIPLILRTAISEAIQTYEAGIHTAAAIMYRRTLDGFCVENGATKKNLAANLKELRDNGVINDQLYEWADALRLSGNEAAHDVKVIFSSADARDLLDFTVAILDFTYSFRVKFEAFKARRGG